MKKRNKIHIQVHRLSDWLFLLTAILAFTAALELFNFVLTVNAKQVVIADSNMRLTYETSHRDVESFLKANDIQIGPYDRVNVSLSAEVEDGMFIEIRRAVNVILDINGDIKEVLTSEDTVGDLLSQEGIELTALDEVTPTLNTKIRDGLNIRLKRYTSSILTTTIEVPYSIIYKNVSSLNKGEEMIEVNGKNGLASVSYKVKSLNGNEVSREEIDYVVLNSPIDRVILRGTAQTYKAPNGKTYKVKQEIIMNSSAYTNSLYDTGKEPGDPLYGITRSGMETRYGVVAVDPDVIPLMSKLYVEGYGEAIAADTGSAIKGNRIDLFYDTRQEALNYGRKNIKVYVLE